MKKTSILIFLSALLLVTSVACNNNGKPSDTDSNDSSSATDTEFVGSPIESLETKDYDGYGFTFYVRSCCEHAKAVFADAESQDNVDAATHKRNEKIFELLNVEIMEANTADDGYPTDLVTALQSNDKICDAILWHRAYAGTMASDGLLLNMANLDYFSFNNSWWASDLIDNYSYKGAIYLAAGHYTTDLITDTGCMTFNKTMFADTFPENDLYDEVRNGTWTLDRLNYYLQSSGKDLDNDGIYIPGDQLAISISRQHFFQFMYASNQYAFAKNDSDIPELVINTEKTANLAQTIYDMLVKNPASYRIESPEAARNVFAQGQAMFSAMAFRDLTWAEMRDMADGYGVLPYPKYNEAQTEYKSRLFAHSSLLCLPYNLDNANRSAHVLEAMARIGYEDVTPVIYEDALKNKYTDTDSWEMMDIIMKGITSDFGDICDGGWFVYTLDQLVGAELKSNFSSYYAQYNESVLTSLANTLKMFERNINR